MGIIHLGNSQFPLLACALWGYISSNKDVFSCDGSIVIWRNYLVVLTAGPEAPRLLAHLWVLLDLCPEVDSSLQEEP